MNKETILDTIRKYSVSDAFASDYIPAHEYENLAEEIARLPFICDLETIREIADEINLVPDLYSVKEK